MSTQPKSYVMFGKSERKGKRFRPSAESKCTNFLHYQYNAFN